MTDTDVPATTQTPAPPDDGTWELARQWKRAWVTLKWAVYGLLGLSFLMIIGQMYLFYNLFADIHWALGLGFVVALTAALFWLVVRPLLSFFSTPIAATPPEPPKNPGFPSHSEAMARLKYDLKYLKALSKNPALSGLGDTLAADMEKGQTLLAELKSKNEAPSKELLAAILTFEHEHIDTRLKAIDSEVEKLIHNEAVGVGVTTAVSMNGTVDAFIVLWRNANLVSRIARMYFGRPHLRGSLMILRDVAAMVVLSRVLDDVTDMTGEIMGGLLGRMGGMVAGPVMDGAINAMMTLKVGYLAKRRCRSFETWSLKEASSITTQAMEGVKSASASVISELLKASGGFTKVAVKVGETAWQGSKSAWSYMQDWFGAAGKKV